MRVKVFQNKDILTDGGWGKLEIMICEYPDTCKFKHVLPDSFCCLFSKGTIHQCTRFAMSEKEANDVIMSHVQSRKRLYGR